MGGGRGVQGLGPGQQAAPTNLHLWQIHWAASPQRIEECILSGKDSNVSVMGSKGGVGGEG